MIWAVRNLRTERTKEGLQIQIGAGLRNNLWRKHCLDGLMEGDWTLVGSLWGKDILNRKKVRHVKHGRMITHVAAGACRGCGGMRLERGQGTA